jgi:SAM-dependent methyltransferase
VVDLKQFSLPAERFDLVINFNYLNRDLSARIVDSLKPGGVLIYETLTRDHLKWKPDFNPAFLLEPGELAAMFTKLTLLKYRERDLLEGERRRSVASLIGRRQ